MRSRKRLWNSTFLSIRRMRAFLWLEPQNQTVAMRPVPRQSAKLLRVKELRISTSNQTSRMTHIMVWAVRMWRDVITPRICAWAATIAAAAPKRPGHALTRTRPITQRASVRTATWPIIIGNAKPRIWKLSRSFFKINRMLSKAPNLHKLKIFTSPKVPPRLKSKMRLSPPIRQTCKKILSGSAKKRGQWRW